MLLSIGYINIEWYLSDWEKVVLAMSPEVLVRSENTHRFDCTDNDKSTHYDQILVLSSPQCLSN